MAVMNRRGFFSSCVAGGAVAASPGIDLGQPSPAAHAADVAGLASSAPRQRLQAMPCRAKLRDVNMLVRTGGRNRTRDEYEQLLARGGFQLAQSIPIMGDLHILETGPA